MKQVILVFSQRTNPESDSYNFTWESEIADPLPTKQNFNSPLNTYTDLEKLFDIHSRLIEQLLRGVHLLGRQEPAGRPARRQPPAHRPERGRGDGAEDAAAGLDAFEANSGWRGQGVPPASALGDGPREGPLLPQPAAVPATREQEQLRRGGLRGGWLGLLPPRCCCTRAAHRAVARACDMSPARAGTNLDGTALPLRRMRLSP